MKSRVELEIIPPAHNPAHVGWKKNSKHYQRIKPEPNGDTITTTAITMVKSTLDKLKETCVINDEDGR